MRDTIAAAEEIKYWHASDKNMVGVYLSPQGPGGMLLDDRQLDPIYATAETLDLPVLAHGGTARPPYSPGTFDLQGMWFLQHGLGNPWAGMAALGAIVGGGVLERFTKLRVAVVETACGWLPAVLDRFDTHYRMSPNHTPSLRHAPTEVVTGGRYFHGIDTWETTLDYVVNRIGADALLFATDWPHGDTAWPEAVQQLIEWETISDEAKSKILGENAMRLCPRLAD
jgi:predicted TIM-barrel fold metal-dependent hydrolase